MINETIRNLKANRIKAHYFTDKILLYEYLEATIKDKSLVGVGDSITLEELGVYDYLRTRDIVFLDKYRDDIHKEDKRIIYQKNFMADYFLSSANAITKSGKIYNLDGNGSRVAPMIYGPSKVIIVCGINKIVENEEEAILRIKNIAAPLDAKRLGKNTPCVKTGKCSDCKHAEKICNYYSIIQGQFDENRIEVVFVDGNYGY